MNSFLWPSIMGVRYTIVHRLFYSLAVFDQDKFQKKSESQPLVSRDQDSGVLKTRLSGFAF